MSFDIALWCLKNDQASPFPRALIDQFIAPHVHHRRENVWVLQFADGGGGDFSLDEVDAENVTGFWINRPGGIALYEAIFEIMRRTPTVLWWPGGCAVADAAVIPNLPQSMIDGVGVPAVVGGAEQLCNCISAT